MFKETVIECMVCNWFILLLFIVCLGWSMNGPPFLFRNNTYIYTRCIQTTCNWSTHELMDIEMFLWTAAGILWVSLKCMWVCKFLVFLPRNGPAESQGNPVSVIEKLLGSLMRALPACNPTVMKELWFFVFTNDDVTVHPSLGADRVSWFEW